MSTESLTSKVHEARVDLGITQQQLADATGISVRTIISIEKGRQFPTLLSAMRIAHYFSLSVDQLFEYKYDDNSEKENIFLLLKGMILQQFSLQKICA